MTQEGVSPDPIAFQVPGCYVGFVINASDKGYYKWHDWCVRYWMNLNFHGVLNDVTWLERLCTVVWLALNALALGENVLVHCRQGKHRSGVLVMLLLGILAPTGLENYDALEKTYFQKNPKVTYSDWGGMVV